jgi:hypothetical protein
MNGYPVGSYGPPMRFYENVEAVATDLENEPNPGGHLFDEFVRDAERKEESEWKVASESAQCVHGAPSLPPSNIVSFANPPQSQTSLLCRFPTELLANIFRNVQNSYATAFSLPENYVCADLLHSFVLFSLVLVLVLVLVFDFLHSFVYLGFGFGFRFGSCRRFAPFVCLFRLRFWFWFSFSFWIWFWLWCWFSISSIRLLTYFRFGFRFGYGSGFGFGLVLVLVLVFDFLNSFVYLGFGFGFRLVLVLVFDYISRCLHTLISRITTIEIIKRTSSSISSLVSSR